MLRLDPRMVPVMPPMTLANLEAQGLDVLCWCTECGHNAIVPTAQLITRLNRRLPMPEIGSHMRCTACGSKGHRDTA